MQRTSYSSDTVNVGRPVAEDQRIQKLFNKRWTRPEFNSQSRIAFPSRACSRFMCLSHRELQRSARKDAAGNTAVAGDRVHAGAASAGSVRTAPNASRIPDACMARANDRGIAAASPAGPAICATRNWPTATSTPVYARTTLPASAWPARTVITGENAARDRDSIVTQFSETKTKRRQERLVSVLSWNI